MVSVLKPLVGVIFLLGAVPGHAAAPPSTAGKMYCCEGGRICGDSLPELCRGRAYRILDGGGNVINEIPAPLTAQQKAEAAAEALRKKELEEHAREQRRKDQALLETYTSLQDIDLAQARAEMAVNTAIKEAEVRIATARKQRKKLEDEAEFYKNKALPPELAKGLRDVDHEIKTQQDLLDVKKGDFASIKAKYDADRKRYGELTGRPATTAAPARTTPPVSPQPR